MKASDRNIKRATAGVESAGALSPSRNVKLGGREKSEFDDLFIWNDVLNDESIDLLLNRPRISPT